MGQFFDITNEFQLEFAINKITELYKQNGSVRVTPTTNKTRSLTQNAALHKYCEELAVRLNESGLDMRTVIKPGVDIPWSKNAVKDFLWRPVQKAVTGDKSTTQPSKKEYQEIYEVLNRHLGQKFGVHIPWPSRTE